MTYIAHIKKGSITDHIFKMNNLISVVLHDSYFILRNDTYYCDKIVDLVNLQKLDDVVIESFGININTMEQ